MSHSHDNWYSRGFAHFYDRTMRQTEASEMGARRKRLLSGLQGNVLEIGAGTGVNFQYYSDEATVIAIEPSPTMVKRSVPKQRSNITVITVGIDATELDKQLDRHSFDHIVCTLVLCTVPDLDEALQRIRQWLKPDGQLILIEHIRSKSKWGGKFEDFIAPAWKLLGDGCHINRKTDDVVKAHGFQLQEETYFKRGAFWYEAVFTLQT